MMRAPRLISSCRCARRLLCKLPPQPIGWTLTPGFKLNFADAFGHAGWETGLFTGPLFANRHYNDYFYTVTPQEATASRPRLSGNRRLRGNSIRCRPDEALPQVLGGRIRALRYARGCGFRRQSVGAARKLLGRGHRLRLDDRPILAHGRSRPLKRRMTDHSTTHLVLIPSYNPGPKVYETVLAALEQWSPVWVVVDGSTDGSAERLSAMAAREPGLRVLILAKNRGKGAAVLHGIRAALAQGYTHVLTMDSDGQHPADRIVEFMHASQARPGGDGVGRHRYSIRALRACGSRAKDLQLVGESRNAVGRNRRFAVRLSRLPDCRADARHAPAARGCGVSISTWKRRCGCAGAALNR